VIVFTGFFVNEKLVLEAVHTGAIARGSYLIVESRDRSPCPRPSNSEQFQNLAPLPAAAELRAAVSSVKATPAVGPSRHTAPRHDVQTRKRSVGLDVVYFAESKSLRD
jgi:hypothetical protein